MPNQSDYDQETGELLNPEFWNGPPDNRTIREKIDDYFANNGKTGLTHFDLYSDWLFYPPIIRTEDEAYNVFSGRVRYDMDRMRRMFNDTVPIEQIDAWSRESMSKYDTVARLRAVTFRFCQYGKPDGWTRYRERDSIQKENGKVRVNDGEKKTYLVEFDVVQRYQLQAHTTMSIDDLFDHFTDGAKNVYEEGMLAKVDKELVVKVKDRKIPKLSFSVTQITDKEHIITSRWF